MTKACIALLPLLVGIVSAVEAAETAKVLRVEGTVWNVSGARKTRVEAGAVLKERTLLRTEAKSEIVVLLGGDVASLIKENAEARLERSGPDWSVRLERGSILSAVKNPGKRPDHFRIRTRAAVMGVRGTTFFVSAGDKDAALCACSGKIALSSPDGKSVVELTGNHHDQARTIHAGSGPFEGRLETMSGEPVGHKDSEAAELAQALGL